MLRTARYGIGVWVLVCGTALNVSAQESGALLLPIGEASAGYAFMRDTTVEENFPAGWYFSAAANLNSWFGVAGEVSGAHRKLADLAAITVRANLYTFMGGPRFFIKRGRMVPFAEILAGAAHLRLNTTAPTVLDADATDTKFALQPGGGVTILLTPNVAARAAVDYRRIVFTNDGDFDEEDDSQVRFIAGVVFGWGAR